MKPIALVVTRNLPPLVGGMERLIWHVIDELRSSYQVHVAGPRGCKQELPADVNAIEIPLQPIALFLFRAKLITLWLALRHRPSIIIAGSGLTAPFVWLAARLIGARCIVYLHGLDIKVEHSLYRLFWIPFFRRFDCVLVNSQFTRQLAIEAKILPKRIEILHPGVELPNMEEAQMNQIDFRSRYRLENLPIMLYVGRVTPRKGLLYFVKEILPHIILKEKEVVLVVIGDDPCDALLSVENECSRVKFALKENGLESCVHMLGCCSDQELNKAYFAANVLVFPVQERKNDIEGFGMVALEAAAHGLPTVAFSVGGVTDAIADGYSGKLILPGDNIAYADAVIGFLNNQSLSGQANTCQHFAASFQWDVFGTRLCEICINLGAGDQNHANQ